MLNELFKKNCIILVFILATLNSTLMCTLEKDNNFSNTFENKTSHKNIYQSDEEVIQDTYEFVIIPLGCHCGVAWWMRHHNLRLFALPFDWAITPYQALYNVIDNDFQDYFKKENLVPSSAKFWNSYLYDFFARVYHSNVDGSPGSVLDKRFQMLFTHDFPNHAYENINQHYDALYEKHSRRIKRFFKAVNSGKHVYFIRLHDITKAETLALYQLLQKKFPSTSFTLISMGVDPQEFQEDWQIPHIKNIFISQDTVNLMSLGVPFWEKFCNDLIAGSFL